VIIGNINPVEAGTLVMFEVSIDLFAPDDIIFLAMRSCDNLNQTSAISEPYELVLDILPPNLVDNFKAELKLERVIITFTAPGDDSGKGTGKYFNFTNKINPKIFLPYNV
jgi:hypothetical protein